MPPTDSARLPLHGLTVLEIGGGAAGAYCGRLLADAGATVITAAASAQQAQAGVLRGEGITEAAYAAFLAAGKQAAPTGAESLRRWAQEADVVLIGEDAGLDTAPGQPRLATIVLSWFGDQGAYRNWRGSDLVVQALTGLPQMAGPVQGPPLGSGDRQATIVAGATAYIAACAVFLSALRRASASPPVRLDISVLEANLVLSEMHLHLHERDGTPMERFGVNRFFPTAPCGIYPCRSGWVGITTVTPDQWRTLSKVLGLAQLLPGSEELVTREMRLGQMDAVDAAIATALGARDAAEWAAIGREMRIPIVVVPDAPGILAHPIFRQRNALTGFEFDGRALQVPRAPLGLEPPAGSPGADGGAAGPRPDRSHAIRGGAGQSTALRSGLRLLDFSMGWAGPLASRLLADFGADVWKIEAGRYPDWWRGVNWSPEFIAQKEYENSKIFTALNRGKRGVSIDLTTAVGRGIALELVGQADAVIENQAAGVMEKFALAWEQLRAVRPDLVMVSMSAFGTGNAWSQTRAYGSTLEHGSGLPSLSGLAGDPPTMCHVALGDPVGGLFGCAALLTALIERQRGGSGRHVNISMVESILPFTTPGLLEFQLTGQTVRRGNRHPVYAPQGVYPAAGADSWLACTVASAEQFSALAHLIGRPDLATDATLHAASGRHARQDEIDAAIAHWSHGVDAACGAQALQDLGIAAAPVLNIAELLANRHLCEAGLFVDIERELSGPQRQMGTPFRQDGVRLHATTGAPLLGQHSLEVLGQAIGMPRARYDALVEQGVISLAPHPTRNLVAGAG